jgi:hypothetical protein
MTPSEENKLFFYIAIGVIAYAALVAATSKPQPQISTAINDNRLRLKLLAQQATEARTV